MHKKEGNKAPLHCGQEQTRIQTEVLSHLLVRSLIRSHSSLIRLLCTAPLHLLVRLLAHFAHSRAHGTVNDRMAIHSVFFSILDHSALQKLKVE